MSQQIIILGTSDFAEEIADLAEDCPDLEVVGFAANEREGMPDSFLGLPVHWVDDLPRVAAGCHAICSIGTTRRIRFTAQVEALGFPFAALVHPSVRVSRTSSLGAGTVLSVGGIIASHATLGRHVIVNRGCLIGHHTSIGDGVTVSPGANIGGRVRIGDGCYIGMGATVLNDVTIGEGAVVGAGALVNKDVPARVQVLGVPARITKRDIDPL